MKSKKSQLTTFMILGVVILSAVVIVYFTRHQISGKSAVQEELETGPVQSYIDACIKSVGENAIIHIGNHGGYFELPEKSTEDYFVKTAYYFYENRSFMPSQTEVEEQLSDYVDNELFFCLRNFVDFRRQGLLVRQGSTYTRTTILPGRVLFEVKLSITLIREKRTTQLVSFSNSIDNIRLKTVLDFNEKAIEQQLKSEDSICISCLIEQGIEKDLHINMQNIGADTILFEITDFNSEIKGQPYKFVFANKYAVRGAE